MKLGVPNIPNRRWRIAGVLRDLSLEIPAGGHARVPQPVPDPVRVDRQPCWVLPKGDTNAETRKAALIFLKFLWDHNFDWARGGGLLRGR